MTSYTKLLYNYDDECSKQLDNYALVHIIIILYGIEEPAGEKQLEVANTVQDEVVIVQHLWAYHGNYGTQWQRSSATSVTNIQYTRSHFNCFT